VKDRPSYPADDPVAWREVTRKALGKTVYLLRLLLVLEIPVLFLAVSVLSGGVRRNQLEYLALAAAVLWAIAALAVTVKGANLVATERARQTLDVLLTTPMTGEEIIRQKLRGVWRMTWVVATPLVTVFAAKAWWLAVNSDAGRYRFDVGWFAYLLTAVLTLAIYLPMLAWVALWIGLKVKARSRAILVALGVLVVWCAAPPLLIGGIMAFTRGDDGLMYLLLFSPATLPVLLEAGEMREFGPVWAPIILNLVLHGGVLYFFMRRCVNNADHYLGRSRQPRPGAAG
jgi:ABC-type transport system involved in multi-copper enzyme maturation permease subunit